MNLNSPTLESQQFATNAVALVERYAQTPDAYAAYLALATGEERHAAYLDALLDLDHTMPYPRVDRGSQGKQTRKGLDWLNCVTWAAVLLITVGLWSGVLNWIVS
jgi:hypothetical protein